MYPADSDQGRAGSAREKCARPGEPPTCSAAPVVALPPHRPLDFRPFAEALSGLTPRCAAASTGSSSKRPRLSSRQTSPRVAIAHPSLVAYYVDRIRRLDAMHLRSVIELNPDALDIAARWMPSAQPVR